MHVNVIDTFHGTVLPDQSVLIKGDRILAMGNRAEDYSASLVLLNHNPPDNIAHTSDINTVVLKGKVYDREALDKMLE